MSTVGGKDEVSLRKSLPLHIRERVRLARAGSPITGTGSVVYWMRLAVRGHENPALDAAILVANALRVPVTVLLQIEDQYPHATARRQMFLLQGARCAQEELAQRGVSTVVQVDREGHRPNTASTLAKSASLFITEEPFCVPWLAGVDNLLRDRLGCPCWLIDCSSVVPSALVPQQACHRAYAYENATRKMHEDRISWGWKDAQIDVALASKSIDAESIDLAEADLAALVAEMDIDHRVGPVDHTIGGSKQGYMRWSSWLTAGGLKSYAKRRNESLDVHGVSRMSAYLNVGMVSPLRLAREATAESGAGKNKFLNEFLAWRGLTYAWCYHFPMPSTGCTLSQLPSWASDTLRRHAKDPRNVISRERLANACSGDRAWDGMQRYLVETGELHNNARMGWGCAIPKWTASPEDALHTLIDLNNTFALDGHSPPSYGGLLGCLGLFSGPKGESAVFGKVSARSPKSKYAAMPSRISALMVGLAAHDVAQNLPKQTIIPGDARVPPAQAKANLASGDPTIQRGPARTWKIKEVVENVEIEQRTDVQDIKKRRWSNLKASADNHVVVEVD